MIGELALDLAEAVQQPPALDLEHLGDAIEALEVGMLRASAHDVVDEGTVDFGELGDLAGVQAQLLAAGPEPVGQRGGHDVLPQSVDIVDFMDLIGLIPSRQALQEWGRRRGGIGP